MKSKASSDFIYFACSKINRPCIDIIYSIYSYCVSGRSSQFLALEGDLQKDIKKLFLQFQNKLSCFYYIDLPERIKTFYPDLKVSIYSYSVQKPYNKLFCAKIPITHYSAPKSPEQIILCQNPYNKLFCAKIPIINYSVPKSI